MGRYVQYGCGFTAPQEWINYDASPTLRFERLPLAGKLYTRNRQRFPANVRYGDIVDNVKEAPGSCDGAYCSHVLEHLPYGDFLRAIGNVFNILKPGGIFRIVVPDLKLSAERYLESYEQLAAPAHQFMKETMLGQERRETGFRGFAKQLFGNSKHLWMWDEKTLSYELQEAGFAAIRGCEFNDCEDPQFILVEEKDRFAGAVAIECRR